MSDINSSIIPGRPFNPGPEATVTTAALKSNSGLSAQLAEAAQAKRVDQRDVTEQTQLPINPETI